MRGQDFFTSYIIGPFVKAWNLFFDVRLPESRHIYKYLDISDSYLLLFIPVVGLSVGMIAYFIAWFFYFLGGSLVAAVMGSIFIILFTEFLSHCRDSSNLVEKLSQKIVYFHKNLAVADLERHAKFMYYYIFAGVFVVRVFSLGLIIYFNHFGWLIIIYTLTFAFEGYLACDNGVSLREELINAGPNSGVKIAIVAFILCLIFGAAYFPSMLLAFIVVGLAAYYLRKKLYLNNMLDGVNIGVAGKAIEILLLLIGIIYKMRF